MALTRRGMPFAVIARTSVKWPKPKFEKPTSAADTCSTFYSVDVDEGRLSIWRACGRIASQPFCDEINRVRSEVFDEPYPASAQVVDPEWLVEIEAVAFVPD